MDSSRTIQMRMPSEWLAIARQEADLAFGGNRSELVRVAVLALREMRDEKPNGYLAFIAAIREKYPDELEDSRRLEKIAA